MNGFSLEATAEKVVETLRREELTVALAESCTGGLVAKAITDVSGASNVFECGVVAYSERIKTEVLGVSPDTLAAHTVVSAEVASEMATGVRRLAGADFGIGITGVAGPGPDGQHEEGSMYIALASKTHVTVKHLQTHTENQRNENRLTAAETALSLLQETIDGGYHGQRRH